MLRIAMHAKKSLPKYRWNFQQEKVSPRRNERPRDEFRRLYCEQHAITPEDFPNHLFTRSLYPQARLLKLVLELSNPYFFRADYDFLHDVGRLRSFRDYEQSVVQFITHPYNHRDLLRKWLCLRISTTRMRGLVRQQLKPRGAGSRSVLPPGDESSHREAAADYGLTG